MLPNNQWIIEEIKEENYTKCSSKREAYGDTGLPPETRKISNKQPNLHLKQLVKEEQTKPKVNRRKQSIKVTAEINEIEM